MVANANESGSLGMDRRSALKLGGLAMALAAGAPLFGCSKDDDLYKGYKKLTDIKTPRLIQFNYSSADFAA